MDIKEFIQTKGKNIRRHPWELARLKMLDFFIRQCEHRQTIVDIGSGDAFLAAAIASSNADTTVTAIDINYTEELIHQLKKDIPGNLLLLKNINELKTTGKADIIILMDVLEHVEDPSALLQQIICHPSVTVDTVFIITVPAYQGLFSQHDTFLGHYKRYTIRSLNSLLKPLSIKVNNNGYCFNTLVLARALQLLKQKIIGRRKKELDGIHNWRGGNTLTAFITSLFWIEFKISWYLARMGIKLPGLTCYSICKAYPS